MDNKLDALKEMYEYAILHNLCRNKLGFSKLIGVANSNLSMAFGGDKRYLTDNFINRVNSALDYAFSTDWLLYGAGEKYRKVAQPTTYIQGDNNNSNINGTQVVQYNGEVEVLKARIKELEDKVEELQKDKEWLQQMLERKG